MPTIQGTNAEEAVFQTLDEAWRKFSDLPGNAESDVAEFRVAMRHAQQVVLLRMTRETLKNMKSPQVRPKRAAV